MTIEVQTKWLERLAELSDQARKDLNKLRNSKVDTMFPSSIFELIGYASSAKTLLIILPKKEDYEMPEFVDWKKHLDGLSIKKGKKK